MVKFFHITYCFCHAIFLKDFFTRFIWTSLLKHLPLFFFYLGFLLRTYPNYRDADEEKGSLFNSSISRLLASQNLDISRWLVQRTLLRKSLTTELRALHDDNNESIVMNKFSIANSIVQQYCSTVQHCCRLNLWRKKIRLKMRFCVNFFFLSGFHSTLGTEPLNFRGVTNNFDSKVSPEISLQRLSQ